MIIGYRSGFGYDIHALYHAAEGQLLVGGVVIAKGLSALAHSDGDVLIHSLIDALLGALNEGDIGEHFPDNDPQFEKISSLLLLERIMALMETKQAVIINIDTTIILQDIKLKPYKEMIKKVLCATMGLQAEQINIKAKTKENLDATGRGEAIEAYTAVLLYIDNNKNEKK